jgi:hypothetical protein
VSAPSDAEVIGRSLDEPEAFGLIYDRHAPTVLRFLGRRVGADVGEGLVGELFRIAFERRKTFDASRAGAAARRRSDGRGRSHVGSLGVAARDRRRLPCPHGSA